MTKSILVQVSFLCNLHQNNFDSNSLKFSSFCFISFLDMQVFSRQICLPSINVGYASHNLQLSHYILPESLGDGIQFWSQLHQTSSNLSRFESVGRYLKVLSWSISLQKFWVMITRIKMVYICMINFTSKNWSEPVFFRSMDRKRPVLGGPVQSPPISGSVLDRLRLRLPHLEVKKPNWTEP